MNKKKIVFLSSLLIVIVSLAGCATPPPAPQYSPLQIQAMQTREFAASKRVAFNAVVAVFQDLGYTIKSANIGTGFINAQSPTRTVSAPNINFFGNGTQMSTTNTMTTTRATAFVDSAGKKSRVRLNFVTVSRSSSSSGQLGENDHQILDPTIYQNAFNQIRQQIFVSTGIK